MAEFFEVLLAHLVFVKMSVWHYIHLIYRKIVFPACTMGKGLQDTVDGPVQVRTVFIKTDWLGVKNTAVACGAYQFNNGEEQQLRRIILYI